MEAHAPTVSYPLTQNLHSYIFSNPFQHAPNSDPAQYPNHTFDGQPIPPHTASLVHDGTGAQLSWLKLKSNSLKIARSLSTIVGSPANFKEEAGNEPIHAPRSTVFVHIPNSMAWAVIALGALAASCTVCPVSTYLSPRELSYVLAKARPQVIVTSVGAEGEGQLRKALQLLLEGTPQDQGAVKAAEIRAWAEEMAQSWDAGRAVMAQKSDYLPFRSRRVWTVDLDGADYFGTSFNKFGVPAALDLRDWMNLFLPPPGSKAEGTIEGADAVAFKVPEMTEGEQRRRVAFLLWSSGTTGQSKGVLVSHAAAVSNTAGIWCYNMHFNGPMRGQFGGGERWIALAPWYHVYGLVTLLLPTIAIGATLILPASSRFDLETYLRTLTKYRATFAHVAPAVAVAMHSTPLLDVSSAQSNGIDLSSVSAFLTGGAPVPVEVVKQIYKRTGKYTLLGYGTTETMSTSQTAGWGLDQDANGPRDELGSAGTMAHNVSIKIQPLPGTSEEQTRIRTEEVRREAAEARRKGERGPLNPSNVGELLIRAPQVMLGYYSGLSSEGGTSALDAELTKGAFYQGGWYRSGDEGVLDANGRLWITGRTKELIKIKGFQVPPAELDALFVQHPEVIDAAATGIVTDKKMGTEEVLLLVVPADKSILAKKDQLEQLAARLSEWVADLTAYYKWPSHYLFAEGAPRNPTGKILRKDVAKHKGVLIKAPKVERRQAKL